jgi:hypothetical protein
MGVFGLGVFGEKGCKLHLRHHCFLYDDRPMARFSKLIGVSTVGVCDINIEGVVKIYQISYTK